MGGGGGFGSDDDDMSGFGIPGFGSGARMGGGMGGMPGMSFGAMPGGMRGRASSGPGTTAPAVQKPLRLTLQDLYAGTTKKLKVTRRLLNGSSSEKVLTIEVKPGWKAGTKVCPL
jgi:DnaJ family protein B protein 4